MGGGLLKTIGYIILFYFVMRILRTIFEPKKNTRVRKNNSPQVQSKEEFIEYEEVD